MRQNSATIDAFAKVVTVMNHMGQSDSKVVWYSPRPICQICHYGLEQGLGIHGFMPSRPNMMSCTHKEETITPINKYINSLTTKGLKWLYVWEREREREREKDRELLSLTPHWGQTYSELFFLDGRFDMESFLSQGSPPPWLTSTH